jgi:hypothetical protein
LQFVAASLSEVVGETRLVLTPPVELAGENVNVASLIFKAFTGVIMRDLGEALGMVPVVGLGGVPTGVFECGEDGGPMACLSCNLSVEFKDDSSSPSRLADDTVGEKNLRFLSGIER